MKDVATILEDMANTFRQRNTVYGDNFKMVPQLVKILWPNGVPPDLITTDQWHLFELILVKLSRFAISDLTHVDSIHDAAVYGAMIEGIITPCGKKIGAVSVEEMNSATVSCPKCGCAMKLVDNNYVCVDDKCGHMMQTF